MTQTILIVEDQGDIASLALLILQVSGYTAVAVDSGEAALHALAEQAFDLVLLDIMLPGIDGWEVCRRIRARHALAELPILLFTVRSTRDDELHPDQALVNGTITKPFERTEFLAKIEQALRLTPAVGTA